MFWDMIARLYDTVQGTFSRKSIALMCKAVADKIPEGAYVLDCAAGTGILTMAAAKKAKHVLCTDMSRAMLIEAMKKARRLGVHNVSFAKRDITALKDKDNTFEAVVAGNVIHLLDEPEKAFSELLRVTKVGGRVLIPTYLVAEGSLLARTAVKIYRLFGYRGKAYNLDEYLQFISECAEKNGCKLYRTEYISGIFPIGLAIITKEDNR